MPITERLSQLYYSVALALHRARHRPPKQKTANIVVVPAHNGEKSIAHTIQALLQQTRRPGRVRVVS
jgi:biofilm PGA synthesis N-glycosyltransferase PgaC